MVSISITARDYQAWQPPTDVFETDERVVVRMEAAGMNSDDFSISLVRRTLVISGTRRDPVDKLSYAQMEIIYGEFKRQIHLPCPVEEEGIEASYKEGILTVELQKTRPRRINCRE